MKPRQLPFFLLFLFFSSCKTNNKYSYAIKDFRKSLQPYLTEIVSKGIVVYDDSSLQNMATDKELIQLGQSEHPVLRASAFREMDSRKSFNFDILMNHLDDTAIVATDAGEFGIWYRSVSDDIIEAATWKDTADKNKTIDQVITKHNYLRSAYTILPDIEPQEKYYPYIKDMTIRKRKSIREYDRSWIADLELAAYGLAKFKKRQDIKVIKDLLLTNTWRMSELSFRLMEDFPDTAYLEVFETYYNRNFYRSICIDRSVDNAVEFVRSIATYKNDRSAKILAAILNKKPLSNCLVETSWLIDQLSDAILDNPCHAYLNLRRQIGGKAKEYEEDKITLSPVDPLELFADTTVKRIRW